MGARFIRLDERERAPVALTIDGHAVTASEGDTLLVAILTHGVALGAAEGGGARAGFCLMGACQDCWVWSAGDGALLRACSTTVAPGMDIRTDQPDERWPTRA